MRELLGDSQWGSRMLDCWLFLAGWLPEAARSGLQADWDAAAEARNISFLPAARHDGSLWLELQSPGDCCARTGAAL